MAIEVHAGRPGGKTQQAPQPSPAAAGTQHEGANRARTAVDSRIRPGSTGLVAGAVSAGHRPRALRGGSRIRTLEGISRRIYSPLPERLKA
jgi:hypothetical protein